MNKPTFLTAAHWGVYRAEVDNGQVVGMKYFEEDPDPSAIGLGIVDSLNAPSRITALPALEMTAPCPTSNSGRSA